MSVEGLFGDEDDGLLFSGGEEEEEEQQPARRTGNDRGRRREEEATASARGGDLDTIRQRLRSMYKSEEARRSARRAVIIDPPQHTGPRRHIQKKARPARPSPALVSAAQSAASVLPPSSGRVKLQPSSSSSSLLSASPSASLASSPSASPARRRTATTARAATQAKPPAGVRDRVSLSLKRLKASKPRR